MRRGNERAGSPFYDAARTTACPANSLVVMKRGRCRACGAGDVSDLLHYFYNYFTVSHLGIWFGR